MKTYLQLFIKNINKNSSKTAIIDDNITYDSQKIINIIEIYKAFIQTRSLEERSRVVFIGDRNIESIAFFHALLLSNLVPVLVDKTLPIEKIEALTKDERYIFTYSNDPHLKGAILLPKLDRKKLTKNQRLKNGIKLKKADDIIFVTHTSGTTGLPKKVSYTESNIAWVIKEYKKIYKLNVNERVLFALPFHYCFGFIACCLSPLSNGKVVILLKENLTTLKIAKQIEKQRIQILVINPYFYNELCKLDLNKFDFSNLKICDSGGDVLPIPIIEKFKSQTDVVITEGYGLTETSSLTHFLFPDSKGKVKLGSVGKQCDGVQSIIIDQNFKVVENNEIGELLVKGPMVINTYDDSKYNKDAFYKDWFRTGDLFYKDKDGYYYLVGRKKDINNVPKLLLKYVANSIPELFSIKNTSDLTYRFISEKELQIYVVPTNISAIAIKQMEDEILNSLPIQLQKITYIKIVSNLPRTGTGKVIKKEL